jgi:hypothetical protein
VPGPVRGQQGSRQVCQGKEQQQQQQQGRGQQGAAEVTQGWDE